MAEFYSEYNNGVTALVIAEHSALFGIARDTDGDPLEMGARIFTFCPAEWLEKDPRCQDIFTGSYEDMNLLLEGHNILRGCIGWSGYVPFSNGLHDVEDELKWVTTTEDVMDAFGRVPASTK